MAGATGRLRMALAADRTADPTTWTKTDITSRTQTGGSVVIRRGGSGAAQEAQPGASSIILDNGDGALTPAYPPSIYHPDLVLGTPVEIDVEAGAPTLLTFDDSGGASTPDTAVLDITGDIAVAVEVESPLRFGEAAVSSVALDLMSKWRTTGNQRSWLMITGTTGTLSFFWTTAGTLATQGGFATRLRLPRYDSGPAVYGAWLDVNNGAGGKTITFYAGRGTLADLIADPTRFIFDTQTEAGTTSIFSSTAPVEIAVNAETTDTSYAGRIRAAVVVEGSFAGTQRARPDFTAQTPGATSFVDAPGRTWTLGASSDIDGHHTRFVGELVAASPTWPGHGVEAGAQVTWELAGVLRRMRQRDEPLQSCLYRMLTSPSRAGVIKAYWPLEDGASALQGTSPIAGVDYMNFGGTFTRFAADATLASSSPLPHTDSTIAFAGLVPPYSSTQTRLDMFFRIDTPNPTASGATSLIAAATSGTGAQWTVDIDDTNMALLVTDAFGGSIVATTSGSDPRLFGTWCLLSVNMTQNGGNVDWTLSIVPIPLGLVFGTSGSFAGTVGTVTAVHNWLTPAPLTGGISFGHIIVSTGQALGWLAPADTAFLGEPAGSRFNRLCNEQGIPNVVDAFYGNNWAEAQARGAKTMGAQRPIKLLDLLAECAVVERAVIGEARELLGLTYRAEISNQDPVLTLTNELGNPFGPTHDDQGTVNDLTVTKAAGGEPAESYRLVDEDSIAAAGIFPHNLPANVETTFQLPDIASWTLHEALTDEMRIPSLQIDLGKDPDLFPDWLAARMGDLIQSDTVPPFYPASEVRQILDGYQEEISEVAWTVTTNGRPAGVWEVGVRDDEELGIRDTGGSALDASFDAGTDTSMDVETLLGPLWAVTAASNSALPFDLDVGGYRISCTAIGAAAGAVQTFTVSTTIFPDVPKTLPAGTPVSVWRPAVRAL